MFKKAKKYNHTKYENLKDLNNLRSKLLFFAVLEYERYQQTKKCQMQ